MKREKGELVPLKDHNDAVKLLLNILIENKVVESLDEIEAFGHRVVHGGNKYSKSVEITDRVLLEIEGISELAPSSQSSCFKRNLCFSK